MENEKYPSLPKSSSKHGHDIYNTNETVKYKPYDKSDAFIEEEGGWFRDLGVKCNIQHTPKSSVASSAHLHDALEIIYIKSGSFIAYINDERHEAAAGDMLLFYSGDIHRIYSKCEDENSYYVIKIHPSFVFDIADKNNGAAYMLLFAVVGKGAKRIWRKSELVSTRVEKTLMNFVKEFSERRPFFDIAVRKYAADLLLFFLRSGSFKKRSDEQTLGTEADILGLVYRAINFINGNFDKDISAKDAAEFVGMSYGSFSRYFSAVTEQSFKEYLNAVRIRHAEEMLISSGMSVEEISAKCAYGSSSYFIMVFRKQKGMTPHAYRKSLALRGGEEF